MSATLFAQRSGYTPWPPPAREAMILAMDQKTWRIELAVAACILAVAIVAFTLMLGHSLCKSMAGK